MMFDSSLSSFPPTEKTSLPFLNRNVSLVLFWPRRPEEPLVQAEGLVVGWKIPCRRPKARDDDDDEMSLIVVVAKVLHYRDRPVVSQLQSVGMQILGRWDPSTRIVTHSSDDATDDPANAQETIRSPSPTITNASAATTSRASTPVPSGDASTAVSTPVSEIVATPPGRTSSSRRSRSGEYNRMPGDSWAKFCPTPSGPWWSCEDLEEEHRDPIVGIDDENNDCPPESHLIYYEPCTSWEYYTSLSTRFSCPGFAGLLAKLSQAEQCILTLRKLNPSTNSIGSLSNLFKSSSSLVSPTNEKEEEEKMAPFPAMPTTDPYRDHDNQTDLSYASEKESFLSQPTPVWFPKLFLIHYLQNYSVTIPWNVTFTATSPLPENELSSLLLNQPHERTQAHLRFVVRRAMWFADMGLGLVVGLLLLSWWWMPRSWRALDQRHWSNVFHDWLLRRVQWLETFPIGMKLNVPLTHNLGHELGTFVNLWKNNVVMIGSAPTATFVFLVRVLACIFMGGGFRLGWTILLDFVLNIQFFHVTILYQCMRVLYKSLVWALCSVGRLVRGRKKNVLRHGRTDTLQHVDSLQLLVGMMILVFCLFLFTTIWTYYTFFFVLELIKQCCATALWSCTIPSMEKIIWLGHRWTNPDRFPAEVLMVKSHKGRSGSIGSHSKHSIKRRHRRPTSTWRLLRTHVNPWDLVSNKESSVSQLVKAMKQSIVHFVQGKELGITSLVCGFKVDKQTKGGDMA